MASSATQRPLVCIGIPTYNRANTTFPDTLASATAQTYENIEIVISDNCSTDGTQRLVEGLGDPRIRYFRQDENIGANANFNACARAARGVYFVLLHDDDLLDPEFVSTCMNAVGDDTSLGVIRTGIRIIDATGSTVAVRPNETTGRSVADSARAWYSNRAPIYCANALLNTRSLRQMGGLISRHNLFQDALAQFRLDAELGRADIADVRASFREHGDSLGAVADPRHWCEDSVELFETIRSLVGGESAELENAGRRFFARINLIRAARERSARARLAAYLTVARRFGLSSVVHEIIRYCRRRARPRL